MEQLGSANLAIFAQQLLPNPKYLHRPRFPHSKVKGGKRKYPLTRDNNPPILSPVESNTKKMTIKGE
jgi:hypothetical protein